jgi:colanic acid/amylovoran biosynthesis protein
LHKIRGRNGDLVLHDGVQTRIGLIGASFETGNMGVGALAAGAIRCIHTQWPGSEIFILDYAKKGSSQLLSLDGKTVEIRLLNIRFSKKLYLSNNIAALIVTALIVRLVPSRKARQWLSSTNPTFQEIYRSDMFASIAGGDSFSDIYGLRRFFYVTLPQILIILMGRKLILLPQTFGPFHSRLSRMIARFITKNAESIYTRDYHSIAEIDRLREDKNSGPQPAFRYDVGFALEPTTPNTVSTDGEFDLSCDRLVGFNVSGLLYMGGYNRGNMFGLCVDYRELVMRTLDLLIAKGASVLLVPHVFGSDESSESDVIACNSVYQACGDKYGRHLGLLRGHYDQGEIKHVIGKCDFFIGSRMHACIAALSQCVPSVCIAYSDKFIGVMETIDHAGVVADARKLSMDELLVQVEQSYDCRSTSRQQLEQSMPPVARAALRLFSEDNHDSRRGQLVESFVRTQTNGPF